MSRLPKFTLFLSLCGLLAIPLIISPFKSALEPPKINTISGYQLDRVAENLDHPTLLTFDPTGHVIVVEGGTDLRIVRLEPTGIQTRLTAPGVFRQTLPITSISYINGRIYVGHGGLISIVKPDGNLDTLPKANSALPQSPEVTASTPLSEVAQNLGIKPAAATAGPDGATYLSDSAGLVWRVTKANQVLSEAPPTGLVILLLSLGMLVISGVLLLRPIFRKLHRFYGRPSEERLTRRPQLTKVSA